MLPNLNCLEDGVYLNNMVFKLAQQCEHNVDGNLITVRYQPLSTKLTIYNNERQVLKKHLCIWPFHKVDVQLGKTTYTLKITWIILWQSRLYEGQTMVVKELLPQRRRRSITMMSYGMCILMIRLCMVMLEA